MSFDMTTWLSNSTVLLDILTVRTAIVSGLGVDLGGCRIIYIYRMDKQNNIELINNESKRIINEIDRIEDKIKLERI